MAIGLGRMFGFEFPENFNYPYISKSISEFWKRWHISLSVWFRDYLFTPLALTIRSWGPWSVVFAIMVTFTLCGFWHGASWNFVVWGFYYGVFLALEWSVWGKWLRRLWRPLQHGYVLMVIMVGWVIFRSSNLQQAVHYLATMFDFRHASSALFDLQPMITINFKMAIMFGCLIAMPHKKVLSFLQDKIDQLNFCAVKPILLAAGTLGEWLFLFSIFLISAIFLAGDTYNPFIYFRF